MESRPVSGGSRSARRRRLEEDVMDIPNASPGLYNHDLAPATERKWGAFSIFNVWTSDVHSLWGYYLAASLFLLCDTFTNFLIAIGLGSLVIFFLMNLVGFAGVKTGVPYPVLARASFGVWGANVPALVRAIVACFWYGAQTAAASGAIVSLLTRTETFMTFHKNVHFLGHSGLEVICFVVIWALQLLIIQKGMETVRRFQDWAGPAVWVMMLILAIGLVIKAGGFSLDHGIPQDVLLAKTKDAGVFGTPGTPAALLAVAATWITYFAALTFAVATLGINVVANFVSPAFDFANVFPRAIDFKKGGYIAACIALVLYPFAPWEGNAAAFVGAIGATMGPLFGVIMVDYYLIAKGEVDVPALYDENGAYRYQGGFNVAAFIAAGIGALFSSILPNFSNVLPSWWGVYGWFFGVAIAGVSYYVLSMLMPRPHVQPAIATAAHR
jgi:cytosine/uracil/thiamine/allantoin permease